MVDRKKHQVTLPSDPILSLVERVGKQKAADMLGISPSNFLRFQREGVAYKPIVLAARYELSKMDRASNGRAITICLVDSKHRVAFDSFVTALGIEAKTLTA